MIDKVTCIYNLYPSAVNVVKNNDTYEAFDKDNKEITLSSSDINSELERLNNAEPMRLLRVERDKRLTATDWRASSDLTHSDDWKTYRQSLRDLPDSASPKLDSNGNLDLSSVTFPSEPS